MIIRLVCSSKVGHDFLERSFAGNVIHLKELQSVVSSCLLIFRFPQKKYVNLLNQFLMENIRYVSKLLLHYTIRWQKSNFFDRDRTLTSAMFFRSIVELNIDAEMGERNGWS